MIENLKLLLGQFPEWLILSILGGCFMLLGLLLSKKIWGGNVRRLKAALDDSAYLAGQWATLGIAQSQLVEKLGRKISDGVGGFGERENQLKTVIRDREIVIARLEKQIAQIEESKSALTIREMEALQLQVQELQKRDVRIQTLEARLQTVDAQNVQNIEEHKKQVRLLLDRIAALEETGGGRSDEVIQENNRQLTELLKLRCRELESLRDEFFAKERALSKLRDQNAILKKGVDEVMAQWTRKKGDVSEMGKLKAQLAETSDELTKVRGDFERQSESNGNQLNDSDQSSAQIDMLLELIDSRDRRVEELEAQMRAGSKGNQIQNLSETIADLQKKVADLVKSQQVAEELKALANQNRNELEAKDLQISILKSKIGAGNHSDLSLDQLPSFGLRDSVANPRMVSESKGIGRHHSNNGGGPRTMVYFGENSCVVGEDDARLIRGIAQKVREGGSHVSVFGFTENEGDAESKLALSNLRAEAVKEMFEEAGVDPSLIVVRGKGEDEGLSFSGAAWKARRVEITILSPAETAN